jgi:hypothetical protein
MTSTRSDWSPVTTRCRVHYPNRASFATLHHHTAILAPGDLPYAQFAYVKYSAALMRLCCTASRQILVQPTAAGEDDPPSQNGKHPSLQNFMLTLS